MPTINRCIALVSDMNPAVDVDEISSEYDKPWNPTNLTRTPNSSVCAMDPNLYIFAEHVQKVYPHCKFATQKVSLQNNIKRNGKLYVYHDTSPVCMGWIGYGDFTVADVSKPNKFIVVSRLIRNRSYHETTWQYNMAASSDLDKTLRTVQRYLRPYSPVEIANAYGKHCAAEWYKEENDVVYAINEKINSIIGHDVRHTLQHELVQLHKGGHIFSDPTLHTAVGELVDVVDIKKDTDNTRKASMSMVCISPDTSGKQTYSVCTVVNIEATTMPSRTEGKFIFDGSYTDEDLPAELMDGLSSLSILEDGQYVRGVGYRHKDNLFYVARN